MWAGEWPPFAATALLPLQEDRVQQAGTVAPTGDASSFEEYVAARGRALWRTTWLLTGDAPKELGLR